jgi:hypothetical protein
MRGHARPSVIGLLSILLGSFLAFAGCNADRSLRPEDDPLPSASEMGQALELTLVRDLVGEDLGPVLGRLTRPADVAAALQALPETARRELVLHGSCVTEDADFRAEVRRLLQLGSNGRGVAGHIDGTSWGRIKAHFMP